MADFNMGAYGPYVTGAGYGLEAFANIAQGMIASKRAKKVAEYNASITEANAQAAAQAADLEAIQMERAAAIAEQDVLLAGQAGEYRETRMREQHQAMLAQTRAIVAGSGLLMRGSPLRVYEETARQQELDVLADRYQTKLQQRGLQEQAAQARYGATLARHGAAERLRVGAGQAGAIRAMRDDTQVLAGLTRAGAALTQGATGTASLLARQQYQRQQTQSPSLMPRAPRGLEALF